MAYDALEISKNPSGDTKKPNANYSYANNGNGWL
jgi:hypothetical protein